jgi:glutamine amidotransferase
VTLIAVLDYGIGNLRSAQKGLERVGADARLTADPGLVRDAAAVVLPGVGNFGRCMEALRAHRLDGLVHEVVEAGTPFAGICVGMQMLYEGSDESPDVPGLGVLPGRIVLLPEGVKRPQMQWNQLDIVEPAELFDGLAPSPWVYFVHSFAAEATSHVAATCDYGGPVTAAAHRDNVWATQFHPEKSGANGLQILGNFVALADRAAVRS